MIDFVSPLAIYTVHRGDMEMVPCIIVRTIGYYYAPINATAFQTTIIIGSSTSRSIRFNLDPGELRPGLRSLFESRYWTWTNILINQFVEGRFGVVHPCLQGNITISQCSQETWYHDEDRKEKMGASESYQVRIGRDTQTWQVHTSIIRKKERTPIYDNIFCDVSNLLSRIGTKINGILHPNTSTTAKLTWHSGVQ